MWVVSCFCACFTNYHPRASGSYWRHFTTHHHNSKSPGNLCLQSLFFPVVSSAGSPECVWNPLWQNLPLTSALNFHARTKSPHTQIPVWNPVRRKRPGDTVRMVVTEQCLKLQYTEAVLWMDFTKYAYWVIGLMFCLKYCTVTAILNCTVECVAGLSGGSWKMDVFTIFSLQEDYYSRSPTQKAWPIRWMAPEQVLIEGKNYLDSHPVSMAANIWYLHMGGHWHSYVRT